jgi:hypothetical protein
VPRANPTSAGVVSKNISGGVAHELPTDLRKALSSDAKALAAWEDITPLSRNEWICWTMSVKTPEKRKEHVGRVVSELKEGVRRPCCWYGCVHRKDKALSPSQKFILSKKSKKQ